MDSDCGYRNHSCPCGHVGAPGSLGSFLSMAPSSCHPVCRCPDAPQPAVASDLAVSWTKPSLTCTRNLLPASSTPSARLILPKAIAFAGNCFSPLPTLSAKPAYRLKGAYELASISLLRRICLRAPVFCCCCTPHSLLLAPRRVQAQQASGKTQGFLSVVHCDERDIPLCADVLPALR